MHKQLLPLLPSKRGRYGLSKGIASLGTILFAALLVWGSAPKENAMPSLSPRLMTTALTAEATVPETETAVDPDSLTVNVSSITTTDLTESFTVSFATQVVTYKNYSRYSNVYLQCTADDFDYDSLPEYTDEEVSNGAELPVYSASLYRIVGTKSSYGDVVIPRYLNIYNRCLFEVTSVGESACVDSFDGFKNVKSILLPDSIVSIPSGAFLGAKAHNVAFHCVSASKPEGWADDWTDEGTDITWGYTPTSSENTELNRRKSSGTYPFSKNATYYLGYHGEGNEYQPMTLTYDVKTTSGTTESRVFEVPLLDNNNPYDWVGDVAGTSSLTFNLDLPITTGESVVADSLVFHDIYPVLTDETTGKRSPDFAAPEYIAVNASAANLLPLSDFLSIAPGRVSYYAGYTHVDIKATQKPAIYEKLKQSTYVEHASALASGDERLRFLFSALGLARYEVTYRGEDGTSKTNTVAIASPVDRCEIASGGEQEIGFIIKNSDVGEDFTQDRLQSVRLLGFSLKLDIYNNSTNSIMAHTTSSTRFGAIYLYDENAFTTHHAANLNAWAIGVPVVYVLGYVLVSFIRFFVEKQHFKNDEFRRVDPKRFWKEAAVTGFEIGLVVEAIFYIIARWGVMNTSIVKYNPLDVYVIVFGVLGLIALGFLIRDIVVAIRNDRKRKQAIRLHLGSDKADDGTALN